MAHSRSSRDYPNGGRTSHSNRRPSREHTSEKPTNAVLHGDDMTKRERRRETLPQYNHNGHAVTKGIHPEGESGRSGFHPIKFITICGRSSSTLSMVCNCLWPIVPVAIALVGLPPHPVCVCSRCSSLVALCTPRVACANLRHQLHCHAARRQSSGLCWPGAFPKDAPKVIRRGPRDHIWLCCRGHLVHGPA